MRHLTASLTSTSPYSQSRYYNTPKLPREIPSDYEERTWRDRLHVNDDGFVFIPPMQFKLCLENAARYVGMQIPGKGKSTYSKHFMQGMIVPEGIVLPYKKDDVAGQWQPVPSDGKKGGTKRVLKCFPVIPKWEGDFTFVIIDDILTKEIVQHHLTIAGQIVGIGVWSPRAGGLWGKFHCNEIIETES